MVERRKGKAREAPKETQNEKLRVRFESMLCNIEVNRETTIIKKREYRRGGEASGETSTKNVYTQVVRAKPRREGEDKKKMKNKKQSETRRNEGIDNNIKIGKARHAAKEATNLHKTHFLFFFSSLSAFSRCCFVAFGVFSIMYDFFFLFSFPQLLRRFLFHSVFAFLFFASK